MAAGSHRPMAARASDLAGDATVEPPSPLYDRAPSAPPQETGQKDLRPYLRAIRVNAASASELKGGAIVYLRRSTLCSMKRPEHRAPAAPQLNRSGRNASVLPGENA